MSSRSDALRIAILSPPWFAVPPVRYGGIEAVVSLLTEGLVANGHEVTLFAAGNSRTSAQLSFVHDEAPSGQLGMSQPELLHSLALLERADDFDVISDHSGPLGLTISGLVATPSVHTVHGAVGGEPGRLYQSITNVIGERARLVSLTLSQRAPMPALPWFANVPNAVDLSAHPCRARSGGSYLFWLGRMSPDKGAEDAIAVARSAGLPLVLAGKMSDPAEKEYFEQHVRPKLDDEIRYVGEVDGTERVRLLHGSRALLFPISWEEPFGLVMIEAMACGVPVIATRRGSVPEVIEHGRTGFIVDSLDEMVERIGDATAIDPRDCRRSVERRFAPERMVDRYVDAFRRAVNESADPAAGRLETVALSA